jgi:hypothetical protein
VKPLQAAFAQIGVELNPQSTIMKSILNDNMVLDSFAISCLHNLHFLQHVLKFQYHGKFHGSLEALTLIQQVTHDHVSLVDVMRYSQILVDPSINRVSVVELSASATNTTSAVVDTISSPSVTDASSSVGSTTASEFVANVNTIYKHGSLDVVVLLQQLPFVKGVTLQQLCELDYPKFATSCFTSSARVANKPLLQRLLSLSQNSNAYLKDLNKRGGFLCNFVVLFCLGQ